MARKANPDLTARDEEMFSHELEDVERWMVGNLPPDSALQTFGESTEMVESGVHADSGEQRIHLPKLPTDLRRDTIFQRFDAHPMVLVLLMLQEYGSEWIGWAMPVVEHAVEDAFGPCLPLSLAKLMAAQCCYGTEAPWERWEAFVPVVAALTDCMPDFEQLTPPTAEQVTVAVGMMNMMEARPELWSEEVLSFMGAVFRYAGVAVPIEPCEFVDTQASDVNLWQPMSLDAIKGAWPSVKQTRKAPVGESMELEQLRKMLGLLQEQDIYALRLRQQMRLVRRDP